MNIQVMFNGKKSYDDFQLGLESVNIQPPSKKKIKESVPFMNGSYDFSTVGSNGEIVYGERVIKVRFNLFEKNRGALYVKYSQVMEWLLGAGQSQLIFTDMPDTYFLAEVEEAPDFEEIISRLGTFTVTFIAEPFRYGVDYEGYKLWDTFNFEIDYLQDTEFDVVGSKVITLYNPGRPVVPIVNASAAMTADLNGKDMQQNVSFSQGTLNNLVVENNKLQLPSVGAPSFARNSIAYLSDGTLVNTNLPRFEPGKFGKAVMVEEGTTNLLTANQSSVETDLSGFVARGGAILSRDTTIAWHGVASLKVVTPGLATGEGFYVNVSALANTTYTGQVMLKGTGVIQVAFWDAASSKTIAAQNVTLTSSWQKVTVAGTFGASSGTLQLHVITVGSVQTVTFYADGLQLEQKPYPTSWILGGSSRSPETLTIPTAGVLNPQEGTVECWVYVNDIIKRVDGIPRRIWHIGRDTDDLAHRLILYHLENNSKWTVLYTGSSGDIAINADDSITSIGWHYFAVTWGSFGVRLYIDGVKRGENSATLSGSFSSVFRLGHRGDNTHFADTLFDNLRISNIARTDEEILAAYQSGQPLPVDEDTTYKLNLDDNLNFGQGGYYISPEYDLSAVGTAATSAISWQEDPDGIQRSVYAKLDDQSDWVQVQNGGPLPINDVDTLIGRKLQIKTKLVRVV